MKLTKTATAILLTATITLSFNSFAGVGDGRQPPPAEQLQEVSTMDKILAWFGF
jgi:hypothetical protein